MLAPQLVGRLLSEMDNNNNIRELLRQCDKEGPLQNALVPVMNQTMRIPYLIYIRERVGQMSLGLPIFGTTSTSAHLTNCVSFFLCSSGIFAPIYPCFSEAMYEARFRTLERPWVSSLQQGSETRTRELLGGT